MAVDNSQLFDMFKSTGTYRLFIDESIIPDTTGTRYRLLPGQFKKGPVNKAVLIHDENELTEIFGQRDKRLEKAGCYSWLIASQMLAVEPVWIINLRQFTEEDKLTKVSISTNASANNIEPTKVTFKSMYDTSNFWKVEPLMLLNQIGTEKPQVLNFGTVTNQNVTIFVVPTSNRNYDYSIQSVQDRYPAMFVPTVLCSDLVSDYMVDVYFFSQNLADFEKLAGSIKFGKYFTKEGLRKTVDGESGAYMLSKVTEAGYIGRVTGSILPDLLDINGNKLSIESAINSVTDTTGVVCKINPKAVDFYYTTNEEEGARFMKSIDLLGGNNITVEDGSDPGLADKQFEYLGYAFNAKASGAFENNVQREAEVKWGHNEEFEYTKEQLDEFVFNKLTGLKIPIDATSGVASNSSFYGPKLPISINDRFVGENGNPVRLISKKVVAIYQTIPAINTKDLPLQTDGTPFPKDAEGNWIYGGKESWAGKPLEYGDNGRPLDKPLDQGGTEMAAVEPSEEQMKALYTEYGQQHNVMLYEFDDALLINGARTAAELQYLNDSAQADKNLAWTDATGKPLTGTCYGSQTLYRYTPLYTLLDSFKGWYLQGVVLRAAQFVDGTRARQNEVLGTLIEGGVYRSLMDANQIKVRYIVDSFKTYIEDNAKYQFVKICNDNKRSLAFLAQPTKYELMTSTDPYFKDSADGNLEAKYVAAGGNTDLAYSVLFSMPGQDYGAPFGGFFANVRYNDGIDDMIIPATGVISNAYTRKFREAGKHAWDAVVGDEWPIAGEGITDVDWVVSQGQGSDLDYLEPAGWNMLQRDDSSNITLLAERTAQTSFLSAFSYMSNMDLVIYIADEIETILKSKLYKRNNAANRLDALTRANAFMDRVVSQGGCQKYENICDKSNNDSETIARGFLVMDTVVYVENNIVIAVHRTTIRLAE